MSVKHDQLATVKLDEESREIVDQFCKNHPFRVSRNVVANAMIKAGRKAMGDWNEKAKRSK